MKRLLCFLLTALALFAVTVTVVAEDGEFYCYFAEEETRKGLEDSIGASQLRYIPHKDAQMYLVELYKDGVFVDRYEDYSSAGDSYGFYDMTDIILTNGNGSYTGKVIAVDIQKYHNPDGSNYVIAETKMSNPFVYNTPSTIMAPVSNVRIVDGEIVFDHSKNGVKTVYNLDFYMEYNGIKDKKITGSSTFSPKVKKTVVERSIESFEEKYENDKKDRPEIVASGKPAILVEIYAAAWDIRNAQNSPVYCFYLNGEKPGYLKGVKNPDGQIMTVSKNTDMMFGAKATKLEAYNISGNNYLKLRDLAMEITAMGFNVDVTWDSVNNAINLVTDKPYTAVGGELKPADMGTREALSTNSSIYLNGNKLDLTAYNINGNNFFKLRDVCSALNISVEWNQDKQLITVDHTKPYTD